MPARRIEVGPLLAVLGALMLLVSLFLDWYDPGVTAWEVFEVLDLLLAAVAVVGLLAALRMVGVAVPAPESNAMSWAAGIALVLVLATLLNHPPAVGSAEIDVGLWLALAGSALMAAGALLSMARVHIRVDVESRRRRVVAVDARDDEDTTRAMPPDRPEPPG
jgi:hypothetical protein